MQDNVLKLWELDGFTHVALKMLRIERQNFRASTVMPEIQVYGMVGSDIGEKKAITEQIRNVCYLSIIAIAFRQLLDS